MNPRWSAPARPSRDTSQSGARFLSALDAELAAAKQGLAAPPPRP